MRSSSLMIIVLLDIDGTLMDTNYLHVEAGAQAFEEVGKRPPRAAIHRQVGKGSDKLIPEFVEDEQVGEQVNELHGRFYAKLQERGHPLPGTKELISSLTERGHEVWIATSAQPEELDHHMKELEAEGKVAGVVSSEEVERSKPAPDVFELALERAGGQPEEAVVIGDTVWDIEAGKNAGVKVVAVMTGGAFCRAELEEAGAYTVYEQCVELLEDTDFPEGIISKE